MRSYVDYYHEDRCHLSLVKDVPMRFRRLDPAGQPFVVVVWGCRVQELDRVEMVAREAPRGWAAAMGHANLLGARQTTRPNGQEL